MLGGLNRTRDKTASRDDMTRMFTGSDGLRDLVKCQSLSMKATLCHGALAAFAGRCLPRTGLFESRSLTR